MTHNSPLQKLSAIQKMEKLFAEYLATLSDTGGERRYMSYKRYAETELQGFITWMKDRKHLKTSDQHGRAMDELSVTSERIR